MLKIQPERKRVPQRIRDVIYALWMAGATRVQIAEAVGMTDNAVIGVVHRMGLPRRPTPLHGGPRKTRTMTGEDIVRVCAEADGFDPVKVTGLPAEEPPKPFFRPREPEPCCFPIWTRRRHTPVYCDAPTIIGKPYCQEHWDVTHVKPKENSNVDRQADR